MPKQCYLAKCVGLHVYVAVSLLLQVLSHQMGAWEVFISVPFVIGECWSLSWRKRAAITVLCLEISWICNISSIVSTALELLCIHLIVSYSRNLQLPTVDVFLMIIVSNVAISLISSESSDGSGALVGIVQEIPDSEKSLEFTVCSLMSLKIVASGLLYMLIFPMVWKNVHTLYSSFLAVPKQLKLLLMLGLFALSILLLGCHMYFLLGGMHPLRWIYLFMMADEQLRLRLCGFWVVCLVAVVPFTNFLRSSGRVANICIRKVFHALVVVMFSLPLLYFESKVLSFVCVAMGVALCALLLLECCRVSASPVACAEVRGLLPWLQEEVLEYFEQFVDKR